MWIGGVTGAKRSGTIGLLLAIAYWISWRTKLVAARAPSVRQTTTHSAASMADSMPAVKSAVPSSESRSIHTGTSCLVSAAESCEAAPSRRCASS